MLTSEEFEARKQKFLEIKKKLDEAFPPEPEPEEKCDISEDEADENIIVGELVMDNRLA